MKRYLLVGLLALLPTCLTGAIAGEAHAPSMLIYIDPQEYAHDVRLAIHPYYGAWVKKGQLLETAALGAMQSNSNAVGLCEGNNSADVIVWLIPQLSYNPVGGYYAQVKARFYIGDARYAATLKALGQHDGNIDSAYITDWAQLAFIAAMQDIMKQYATDSRLQETIRSSMANDVPHAPCAMVSIIPTH